MAKCIENCFECPYEDCICDADRNFLTSKLDKECKKREMTPEQKAEYLEYCKEYYRKNKDKMHESRRNLRQKRRKQALEEQGAILDFGAWLYSERKKRNLTQTELGRILLTDANVISKFEKGLRVPNFNTLTLYADRLGYELKLAKKGEA